MSYHINHKSLALELEGVAVSYDAEPVIEDVSLHVPQGALVGIVGPNGAGKSTLIKAIVGTVKHDVGTIQVLGLRDHAARTRITYVPQRGSVDWDFPVTVYDVVAQGRYHHLGLFKRLKGRNREMVDEALQKVGMTDYAHRQIGALSGGQQQRVFLARALAHDGDIFLMDEPFVGVDAATEYAIALVLRQLQSRGKTVLVVHHDLSTVREYFSMVLLLNKRVIAFGDTEKVFTPAYVQRTYEGKLAIFEDGELTAFGSDGGQE